MSYEMGVVYIWQRCDDLPELLGTECEITGPGFLYVGACGRFLFGWPTTSQIQWAENCEVMALTGDLRRKCPPKGEQSIMDHFKKPVPELEPA